MSVYNDCISQFSRWSSHEKNPWYWNVGFTTVLVLVIWFAFSFSISVLSVIVHWLDGGSAIQGIFVWLCFAGALYLYFVPQKPLASTDEANSYR